MRPAPSSDLRQSSIFLSTVPRGTLSRFLPSGVHLVQGPLVCKNPRNISSRIASRRLKPKLSPGSHLSGWLSAGLALAQHETQGEAAQLRKRSTWNVSGFMLAMGGSGICRIRVLVFPSEDYRCSTWNTRLETAAIAFAHNGLIDYPTWPHSQVAMGDYFRSVSHNLLTFIPLFTDLVHVVKMTAIFSEVPSVGKNRAGGTPTAPLIICALHQVITSRLESQLSCIVRESYAQTKDDRASNSSMGAASPLSENHLFLASILTPRSHHHHGITIAWQRGGVFHLLWAWFL